MVLSHAASLKETQLMQTHDGHSGKYSALIEHPYSSMFSEHHGKGGRKNVRAGHCPRELIAA